jgi:hypothetical protein
MAGLICPECGAENPEEAERCQECDAPLIEKDQLADERSEGLPEDPLDFLAQADDDLPGLLHALKHEDDQAPLTDPASGEESVFPQGDEPMDEKGEPEEEETLPEWLIRVRQRAQEEEDSIGEVTQKLVVAQDHLKEEISTSQHENFSSWIEGIREEDGEKENQLAEETSKKADAGAEKTPSEDANWLAKIRKMEGKFIEESDSETKDKDGDSLLQWLVALEEGTEQPEALDETPVAAEEVLDDVPADGDQEKAQPPEKVVEPVDIEATRQMVLSAPTPVVEEPEAPLVDVTRSEQGQADQLTATITDEKAARAVAKSRKAKSGWAIRLIVAIVLIGSVVFSLYFTEPAALPSVPMPSQYEGLSSWVDQLPADAHLLLVFDYQPAYAAEMALVAEPVLEEVIQAGRQLSVLYTTPMGELLSQTLLSEISAERAVPIDDLGYHPFSAFTAYQAGISEPAAWVIPSLPKSARTPLMDDFAGIILLSDTFEGARVWIDQISALMPGTPLNLILAAQAGPMLKPYYDSGQVIGMIAGLGEARNFAAAQGESGAILLRWRAYQTGMLLMVTLIVTGILFTSGRLDDEGEVDA